MLGVLFALYILAVAYMVFFSRNASESFRVHASVSKGS